MSLRRGGLLSGVWDLKPQQRGLIGARSMDGKAQIRIPFLCGCHVLPWFLSQQFCPQSSAFAQSYILITRRASLDVIPLLKYKMDSFFKWEFEFSVLCTVFENFSFSCRAYFAIITLILLNYWINASNIFITRTTLYIFTLMYIGSIAELYMLLYNSRSCIKYNYICRYILN